MVEALGTFLQGNDRGVTFATYRPGPPGQWPPVTVLRTDFLIAPSTDNPFVAEAEMLGLGRWARLVLESAMPPLVETVLMTLDGKEVGVSALLRPYDKTKGDRNLSSRPDLFERLTAHLDWTSSCLSALQNSQSLLSTRPSVAVRPTTGAKAVRKRLVQRIDRENARQFAGLGAADVEFDSTRDCRTRDFRAGHKRARMRRYFSCRRETDQLAGARCPGSTRTDSIMGSRGWPLGNQPPCFGATGHKPRWCVRRPRYCRSVSASTQVR